MLISIGMFDFQILDQFRRPAMIPESKTAGRVTPAVGEAKGDELISSYIPPAGGALEGTWLVMFAVVISGRASFCFG